MSNINLFEELTAKNILTAEDNHLRLFNQVDISSYGSKAWAFTLQELGKKGGKKLLYRLGYIMGKDSAKEILSVVKKKKAYITEKLMKITNLIEITGFGITDLEKDKLIVIKNHIINYGVELYGNKSLVQEFYRGVYTAFLEEGLGKKFILTNGKSKNKLEFAIKNV